MIIRNVYLGMGAPKICVPITAKTIDEIRAAAREMKTLPAELAEWRADWFDGLLDREQLALALAALREELGEKRPLIFTVRTKNEGGQAALSQACYRELLEYAAALPFADVIDVELFTAGEAHLPSLISKLKEQQKTVILSSHEFGHTPKSGQMAARMETMIRLGADIPKLAVMPGSRTDVTKLLKATARMQKKYPGQPLITMAMGELGLISRLSGETFGSCVTFGSGRESSAPGQIPAGQLKTVLDIIHQNLQKSGHIFLIGFMGAGKSTVAKHLSERTGLAHLEADQIIEEKWGMKIADIFAQHGEAEFRRRETEVLMDLAARPPAIISCGGGIVLKEGNVARMKETGTILLLGVRPDTVYQRVRDDRSRPNLKGRMSVAGIKELMDKRAAVYQKAAQITVCVDDKTPAQVSREICMALGLTEKNS